MANNKLKTAGIIIGIIILLGTLIYALTGLILEPYLKDKLVNKLQKINNVSYNIDIERFDIQTFGGNIYMEGVEIVPVHAPTVSQTGYKLLLDKLQIEGLNINDYIFNNEIDINRISISNPTIVLYQYVLQTKDTVSDESSGNKGAVNIDKVKIDNISLRHGEFRIINSNNEAANRFLQANIDIEGENILYDLSDKKLSGALSFDRLSSKFSEIKINTSDSLRIITASTLKIQAAEEFASIDSIRVITRYDKYEIGNQTGHEASWMDIFIQEINFNTIKVKKLLMNGAFLVSKINFQRPEVNVFRDKRLPKKKKKSQLPYAFLNDLNRDIAIDTLKISNGNITYQEHVKNAEEAGLITFNDFNVDIQNITNDSAVLEKTGHKGYMHVQTAIFNTAILDANFTFNLRPNATHTVNGSLGSMNLETLNKALMPLAATKIESGQAESMTFNFSYNEKESNGEMKFLYSNLDIQPLTREKTGFIGEQLSDLYAGILIDDENTKANPRIGEIHFFRNENKSVLNYWWKSLLTGILNSIGVPQKAKKLNGKKTKE
ncbi:MAG: hypothetical protein ACNS60_18280 [Candidatus Cyclobacteriaceae bacterium M2_1C_046]